MFVPLPGPYEVMVFCWIESRSLVPIPAIGEISGYLECSARGVWIELGDGGSCSVSFVPVANNGSVVTLSGVVDEA